MTTEIEKTAKTVEEAVESALNELGVSKDDVEIEVLESPTKKLFGLFGSTPAKVRVKLKTPPTENKIEVVEEVKKVEESAPQEEILNTAVEEPENKIDAEQAIIAAKNFLSEVFAAMKMQVGIEVKDADFENEFVLDLSGENLGVLIGKRGQTLDALQYIVNLSVNRENKFGKVHFVLDVENYRKRREETLKKLAKSVAERALRMRQDVRLEPMNKHERRIIHSTLQENDRVETHSKGEDPYRYIIVSPKKKARIKI